MLTEKQLIDMKNCKNIDCNKCSVRDICCEGSEYMFVLMAGTAIHLINQIEHAYQVCNDQAAKAVLIRALVDVKAKFRDMEKAAEIAKKFHEGAKEGDPNAT